MTTDWTLTYAGVTFGSGGIDVISVEGLEDLPEVRVADTARAGVHGEHPGRDLVAGRTIRMRVEVIAATEAAFRTAVDDVRKATTVRAVEEALVFKVAGQAARRVTCRPRRRRIPTDVQFALGSTVADVEFHATDPRIYTDVESSGTVAFPAGGTGRTYPRTYPRVYGAAGVSSVVAATNSGDTAVPWRATINGPWTNPTITHVGQGLTLTINVTLTAGQQLVVDSDDRTVLLGGTASRYGSLAQPATWFELRPGANEVRFGGASGTGTALLAWRSGWL